MGKLVILSVFSLPPTMRSAYCILLFVTSCVLSTVSGSCICSNHPSRHIYKCDDDTKEPFSTLRYDGLDGHCLAEVNGLHVKSGWKAGLYVRPDMNYQRVVYIRDDGQVVRQAACGVTRLTGSVTMETGCHPEDHYLLNPTKPTPPTTPTPTPTTPTPTPTTPTPTTPTPTPTTPTPTPTHFTLGTVPTMKPSTICNSIDMLDHLLFKTSATHQSAKFCAGTNTNSGSDALLLAHCHPKSTHTRRWHAGVQVVVGSCATFSQGDPIGLFVNGRPLGEFAAFWKCKANSFEIIYQTCGRYAKVYDSNDPLLRSMLNINALFAVKL